MDLLNAPAIATDDDASGSTSFADIVSDYFAPEGKLPTSFSALPPLPPLPSPLLENPFSYMAPELSAPSEAYPLSAFAPFVPGSPVNAYSPSSSPAGSSLSYDYDMSDDALGGNASDFAIDPTFLGAPLPPLPELPELPQLPVELELEDLPVSIKAEEQPTSSHFVPRAASASASIAEDDDEDMSDMSADDDDESMAGLKGKGRKASSASGKKAKTSVAAFASATLHATSSRSTLPPVPEWADKPDPESYKKLNPKEKRQLRNKISARNFRHRKKEYITTLEEEIASRDTIIDQLRGEVGVVKSENKDLHREVDSLKSKWEALMLQMAALKPTSAATVAAPVDKDEAWALDSPKPVPAALPPVASTSAAPVTRKRATNDIAKPNLQKDVAPGLKRSGTGSWTTQGMGGYMPVHTTLLPEFNLGMKPSLSPFSHPTSSLPSQHLPLEPTFTPATFLSGKEEPFHDLVAFQSPREAQRQHDQLAQLAAQTLLGEMARLFVGAFATTDGGLMSPEKVASVLSGRSSLRVVSNDSDVASLTSQVGTMGLADEARPSTPTSSCGFEAVVMSKEEIQRPKTPSA
ncbi:hypothetical protein RQP46_000292 [Phenoliferia psychrophenolica]